MLRQNLRLQSPYPSTFRISVVAMHSPRLLLSNRRPENQSIRINNHEL